jgi:hypothetical protein
MSNIELQMCYFCQAKKPYPSCLISYHNDLWICSNCDEFTLPIKFNNHDNECPVCYEIKKSAQLPCEHSVCVDCYKTIYFGITSEPKPKYDHEIENEGSDWPFSEDDCDYEEKQNEFEKIEFKYDLCNCEKNTYEEMIINRNISINHRPDWMNTEEFINYENVRFKYHIECDKLDKEWEKYDASKTRGNSKCPLCRA